MPNRKSSNSQVCGEQGASKSHSQFQQLKLALDVHAASLVVVRMVDGAKPQPPQRFKPADFLVWAKKQAALAKEVVSWTRFEVPHQARGFAPGAFDTQGIGSIPTVSLVRRLGTVDGTTLERVETPLKQWLGMAAP